MLLVLSCDDPLSPNEAVARLEASPPALTLTAGETRTVAVRVLAEAGGTLTRRVFWSTQDPTVATVTQAGLVTAVAPGTTQIAASSGGRAAVVPVTVLQRPVTLVRVTPATSSVQVGASTTLTAQALDAQGNVLTGRPILWGTSAATVATVSSTGQVSGIAPGSVTITATAEGINGTASVTVTPVPVAAVTVSPNTASLTTGETLALAATTVDAQGGALSGRVVTWASSNATIASVSSTGVVSGVAPGNATITATSEGRSGSAQIRVTLVPVDTISLTPATSTVASGQTVQLQARLTDARGNLLSGRVISWSSDQPAIATVDQNGLVSGVAQGAARISAMVDGKTGTATVNVTPIPIARIDLSPVNPTLLVGGTQQLTATPRDAQGIALPGRVITWISGSSTVATVTQAGLVTAIAPGSAVIFAASEGQVGSTTVTVGVVPVATVTVTPPSGNIQQGLALQLTATARDAQNNIITGRPVTWTSSNEAVATVSSTGRVVGIAQGTVTIRATIDGVLGSGTYTITPIPVASVTVTPNVATLVVTGTVQLTANLFSATGEPLSPAGRTISWSTSNPAIATVNASGLVTGLSAGTATIAASSEGQSGSAAITVSLVPVASVTITPAPIPTLNVGVTQAITATARDAAGNVLTGRPVTWSSSNPTVATVNTGTTASANTITAVAAGSATISAVVGGVTGVGAVTVILVPIANIAVTPNPATVVEGGSVTLTATATDASGNVLTGRTIVWSSSNPANLSVSQTGVVTAVINSATQSATITASSPGGGAGGSTPSGTATVSATFAAVATVQVNPASANLSVGTTTTLIPTLLSSGGQTLSATGRTITWALRASDPAGVATVNPTTGLITAVAQGGPVGVVATASSPGQTGTLPADTSLVTVTNVPVATVTVTPTAGANPGTVHVGSTYARAYTAKTYDAGGTELFGRPVVWTSLNQSIATVDPNTGVVTGVAVGSTTIRATSEGVNGNHAITVDLVPVTTVVVSPPSATLNPTTTPTVALSATPQDSAGATISGVALGGRVTTWSSSNLPVATVNASGVVTAVAAGSATITGTIGGTGGTSSITVIAPVQSVTIVLTPDSVIAPGTLNGTATAWSGPGGTGTALGGRGMTIASSNPAFATVSPGSATTNASGQVAFTLTGVAAGNVTVTATSETVPQTTGTIRVLNPVATVSVAITPADSVIGAAAATATATLRDAGNNVLTGRPVAWTSSNTGAATVTGGSTLTTTVNSLVVTANTQTNIDAVSEGKTGTSVYRVLAPVNAVTLTSAGDSVLGTGSLPVTATLKDAGNNVLTGRPVTWVSRSPGVATVNAAGLVTGVTPGTARIVATSEAASDSVLIRVLAGINTIALTPATDSIIGTGTLGLTATATDAGSTPVQGRTLSATSSATGVATIAPASGNTNASGQVGLTVTAVATGSSTLTVSAEGKNTTRLFRVLAPVASVTLTASGDSIIGTGSLPVTATLRDASSIIITGRPISWASSNMAVATVNAMGVVSGLAPGTTNISATSEGITSANYAVRVLPAVASVTVTAPDSSMLVSETTVGSAVARDAATNIITGRPVTWTSTVPSKATVTPIGSIAPTATISSLDSGSTTIRATIEGIQASFVFTVSLVPAASIPLNPTSGSDSTGKQITFVATPRDSVGGVLSGRVINWTSSNTSKATVAGGVTTLLDSGTVYVRASTSPGTGAGGVTIDSAAVTIVLTPVNAVSVPATESVGVGANKVITATVTDLRGGLASGRACAIASANTGLVTATPASATTNASGQVAITITGVAAGTANVTVTCETKVGTTAVTVP